MKNSFHYIKIVLCIIIVLYMLYTLGEMLYFGQEPLPRVIAWVVGMLGWCIITYKVTRKS